MEKRLRIPSASDIKETLKSDHKALPSFTQVVAKMLSLCNDPNAPMADIAKLVETDPGISTRVLGIVNSAFSGLKRKVSAVSEAVVYLGIDEVKKICLGVTFFEKMIKAGNKNRFDRTFFWRHCLSVAILSQAIAKEIGYPRPEDAYTAGLLHDFGKIVLDQAGRVSYAGFIEKAAACTGQMSETERDLMGMGHDDVGAYYGRTWHFPDDLCLVIQCHHRRFAHLDLSREEMQLISIVSLADFLAWTQGMGAVDIICPPLLQPEVGRAIRLDTLDYEKLIRKMDEEIESTSRFYQFSFPSSDRFRANLLQANLKLSAINSDRFFSGEPAPSKGISPPGADGIAASLTAPHHSLNPKKIISATLRAICDDFGFDRIYILKMVKRLRRLQVTECLDRGQFSDGLSSARISLDEGAGRFIRCLRNKEPLVISGATPGEKKALETFSVRQMLIVPFCSHNKVIGLLGMDHAESGKDIEPALFSSISVVANELGLALENASTYSKARSVSLHDGLTGLLNRMALGDLLRKSFRKAVDGDTSLSLAMVDVDFFKKFNDRFGHQAGDNVLKLIAGTLKKISRPSDHVGRYGGEEFIVVLNDTDLPKAAVYAERIRREIETLGTLLSDRYPGLKLTVSIGISQYDPDVKNQDALVSKADKALYRAKAEGRNRVAAG
ncbi:MAG: HDOD domain-containing protein [Desulfobacter sp.]|nr:MAG: HDOD domain-containing protein [Desulfobacter sp.]